MNQTQPTMQQPRPAVSKWLWIVLIIVILAAAGFFGWYFLMGPGKTSTASTSTTTTPAPSTSTTTSTTTSSTADWKTYTNTTYGFSIKYPPTYAVAESTNASGKTIAITNGSRYNYLIEIEAANTSHDTTTGKIDQYKVGSYTVNDMARESGSTVLANRVVVINQGNNTYVYHSAVPQSDSDLSNWKSDFDTILSTFQFTK